LHHHQHHHIHLPGTAVAAAINLDQTSHSSLTVVRCQAVGSSSSRSTNEPSPSFVSTPNRQGVQSHQTSFALSLSHRPRQYSPKLANPTQPNPTRSRLCYKITCACPPLAVAP
ncbi:hypothetical protein COCCADRAFT_97828, partial [Bipolaris zeicola 26-R-13]